jgi:hypothetical protein
MKGKHKLDIHGASHPRHFLTFVQLLQAESAYEVFGMKFAEHRGDAATGDRFGAASAQRTTFGVVVRFAVGHAFMVEKRATVERLSTILRNRRKVINYCGVSWGE